MDTLPNRRVPRIETLDIIRGVAVLGILLMNIAAFAMPRAAYDNPAVYGGHTGVDLAAWAADFVFVDGKMRGLFSFLFGASMLLVIERATARGESPARVHFARMAWLFVFGMAHMILLWWGDILAHYALVGCLAWLFRKRRAHELVGIGILLVIWQTLLTASLPGAALAIEREMRGTHPSAAAIAGDAALREDYDIPTAAALAGDLALHRGPYQTRLAADFPDAISAPPRALEFVGMETLAYMLFGMAGLKSGMLTGAWPRAAYRRGATIGLSVGVAGFTALAIYVATNNFALVPLLLGSLTLTTLIRPPMIAGWACLIILLARPSGRLTMRLAAVGRMAFSNYIAMTILCTTLFDGLALYGHFSRAALYPFVVAIWAMMLAWSKPWLTRFRYGPLEWLWRSLVRLSPQMMRGPA